MKSEGHPSGRVPTRDLSRSSSGPQDCPSISCCKERSCFSRTPITASPPTRRAFRLASGSIRDMRPCISSGNRRNLCGLHPPAPCHPLHACLCRFLHAVRHSRYLHQPTSRHAPRHIGESVSLVAGLSGLGHRTLWAMARAATKIDDSAASACGRLIALYSRFLVREVTTQVLFATPLGSRPVVWISWHEGNLLTLAVHQRILRRVGIAFVPTGLSGQAMRGWLEGLDIAPVPLAEDARRGLGLRQMEAAIAGGKDVLIAVDGPRGPRHSIARGALWLARSTCAEVRPVGSASSFCLRLPRWDRLIVPLPGARNIVAVGAPVVLRRARSAIVRGLHQSCRGTARA